MKLIHSLNRTYINYYTLSKSNFFALLNSGMKWVKQHPTVVVYMQEHSKEKVTFFVVGVIPETPEITKREQFNDCEATEN